MEDNAIEHLWCIAYINKVFIHTIDKDLQSFGYQDIKFNIPTVKVLKKRFKGKNYYDEIPLLFNYGFFRLPIESARDQDYLQRMKVAVQGIYNWLWRPKGLMSPHIKNPILVATIKMSELAILKRISLANSIYSSDDISGLSKGKFIILRGYPFEGMAAEVVEIMDKQEKVKVKLLGDNLLGEPIVSFSNIFYSVYSGHDPDIISDNTVEGLIEKSRVNSASIYTDGSTKDQ